MKTTAAILLFAVSILFAVRLTADPASISVQPLQSDRACVGGNDSIPFDPGPEDECRVTARILRGAAQVRVPDGGCGVGYAERPLIDGDSFGPSSKVMTGTGGLVELSFPDGNVVRVGPGSTLFIDYVRCTSDDSPVSLRLDFGSMWSRTVSAADGGTSMRVETDEAVASAGGTTFVMERYELDTIFKRSIIELYPPEYRHLAEGLDTTMRIDVPFEGTVTRVAVFDGGVDMTESFADKRIRVAAGEEATAGIESIPTQPGPIGGRNGFNASGEFAGSGRM